MFRRFKPLNLKPRPRVLTRRHLTRGALLLGAGVPLYINTLDSGSNSPPFSELLRSYAVYSMCSIPALVDYSPQALEIVNNIPLVKQVAEAFIRVTFFDQFVGGDTAAETLPLLRKLRSENVGALLVYSAEVDEASASSANGGQSAETMTYKQVVEEVVHCVTVAGEFDDQVGLADRSTWVAVKVSALLPDAKALKKLSEYIVKSRLPSPKRTILFPGCATHADLDVLNSHDAMSAEDIRMLKELYDDLVRICERAQEKGVRVIFDAEYSWYQPALDAYTLALMRKFNALPKDKTREDIQPLVYATYQAYLRRTPEQLAQSIEDARAGNYSLGVKLVRGAYHHKEEAVHGKSNGPSISPDPLPPVWSTKADTDACFDGCAEVVLDAIQEDVKAGNATPSIGVLFGTHNWKSCDKILEKIQRAGLGVKDDEGKVVLDKAVGGRIMIGQLYGEF